MLLFLYMWTYSLDENAKKAACDSRNIIFMDRILSPHRVVTTGTVNVSRADKPRACLAIIFNLTKLHWIDRSTNEIARF